MLLINGRIHEQCVPLSALWILTMVVASPVYRTSGCRTVEGGAFTYVKWSISRFIYLLWINKWLHDWCFEWISMLILALTVFSDIGSTVQLPLQ